MPNGRLFKLEIVAGKKKYPYEKKSTHTSDRRGRSCIVSHVNPGRQGTLAFNSFRWRSVRIFNRLPIHIRNISACSIDKFKSQLDSYLRTIPDLPSQPGYNNSLDGGDGIQRWTLRDGLAAE